MAHVAEEKPGGTCGELQGEQVVPTVEWTASASMPDCVTLEVSQDLCMATKTTACDNRPTNPTTHIAAKLELEQVDGPDVIEGALDIAITDYLSGKTCRSQYTLMFSK